MPKSRSTALAPSIMFSRAPVAKSGGSQRFAALKAKSKEKLSALAARSRVVASAQKHRLTSVGCAIALGLARRYAPDTMEKLTFGPINPELTVGLGAWIASYWIKSPILDHLATVGLALGAYQFASGMGNASEGLFAGEL